MNLFWYKFPNFGDMLSPYLLSKFSGVPIKDIKYVSHESNEHKYLITGSILSVDHMRNATVFGAGFINSNNYFTGKKIRIAGVRGNMTLKKIKQHFGLYNNEIKIDENVVIGEPSLCLPFFMRKDVVKKYKAGVIPHLQNYEQAKELYKDNPDVVVINLRQEDYETLEDCIERVVLQICLCEETICSSLHGIIVSVAYGVPSRWVYFKEGSPNGDGFKFYDFIDSVDDIYRGGKLLYPTFVTAENANHITVRNSGEEINNKKINPEKILEYKFL